MRIDKNSSNEIKITLSKRNLEALLEKLTWDSARTIITENSQGVKLIVHCEHNIVHYATREPGPMIDSDNKIY